MQLTNSFVDRAVPLCETQTVAKFLLRDPNVWVDVSVLAEHVKSFEPGHVLAELYQGVLLLLLSCQVYFLGTCQCRTKPVIDPGQVFCCDELASEQVREPGLGRVLQRCEQVVQVFLFVLRWPERVLHRTLLVCDRIEIQRGVPACL